MAGAKVTGGQFNQFLGSNYGSINELKDALANAKENPVAAKWSTTGASGFQLPIPGTSGYVGEDNKHYFSDGSLVGGTGYGILGAGGYRLTPGYKLGDVNIPDQQQAPENPGIRKAAFASLGVTIPVSIGSRAIAGNIVDASDITPRLIGYREYPVTYKIPIYKDLPGSGGGGGGGGGDTEFHFINPEPEEHRISGGGIVDWALNFPLNELPGMYPITWNIQNWQFDGPFTSTPSPTPRPTLVANPNESSVFLTGRAYDTDPNTTQIYSNTFTITATDAKGRVATKTVTIEADETGGGVG